MGEDVVDFEQGGADLMVSGYLSKAVLQAVLLFGAETSVLTPMMERALSSFQNRVARRLIRRQPSRRGYGSWYHPLLVAAMAEAGLEEIGTYITRR